MTSSPSYIGRFAPSPTGKLHAGSLLAAVASFLDARANNGHWLLRIENLDPPREEPGADVAIIESLQAHGLQWDREISWQGERLDYYQQALDLLAEKNLAYQCSCSRQQLASQGGNHIGNCYSADQDYAWRFVLKQPETQFDDQLCGVQFCDLNQHGGDFVIKRKDGLFAYQLAVTVDDFLQGITHVVRGNDLLDSSFRQIALQQALGYPQPTYCHLPVLVDSNGQKLSKQSHAPVINNERAEENLLDTLAILGQPVPPITSRQKCEDILLWAAENWDITLIPTANKLTRCE